MSASRCRGVKYMNRGLGVRSNGRSRSPKNFSYISVSPADEAEPPGNDEAHRNGEEASGHRHFDRPASPLPVEGARHRRYERQHRQREGADKVGLGSQRTVAIVQKEREPEAQSQAAERPHRVDLRPIGTDRPLRKARGFEQPELLAKSAAATRFADALALSFLVSRPV